MSSVLMKGILLAFLITVIVLLIVVVLFYEPSSTTGTMKNVVLTGTATDKVSLNGIVSATYSPDGSTYLIYCTSTTLYVRDETTKTTNSLSTFSNIQSVATNNGNIYVVDTSNLYVVNLSLTSKALIGQVTELIQMPNDSVLYQQVGGNKVIIGSTLYVDYVPPTSNVMNFGTVNLTVS